MTITAEGARPVFHVTVPGCPCTPQVRFLSVYRSERRGVDFELTDLWTFSATRALRGEVHTRYGEAPPGFQSDAPARRLEPGVTYQVTAAGDGDSGHASFRITNTDVIQL